MLTTLNQSLPAQKLNTGSSYMAFISYIKAIFTEQSFAHVGAESQTNIETYIQTHNLFEKLFQ